MTQLSGLSQVHVYQILADPLKTTENGVELLAYCNGIAKWISGDLESAAEEFSKLSEKQNLIDGTFHPSKTQVNLDLPLKHGFAKRTEKSPIFQAINPVISDTTILQPLGRGIVPPRVVILTTLAEEFLAVREHLSELREILHPDGIIYEFGRFRSENVIWDVIIAETGPGNNSAAIETKRVISFFNPDVVLSVGVASGLKDVTIGDVVVSTKVYNYEIGRIGNEMFNLRHTIELPSSYYLEQSARATVRDWRRREDLSGLEDLPRAFVTAIAAGERVVASMKSRIAQYLTQNYEDALAVDMEGFGFLSTARQVNDVSAIVIRGIADLLDSGEEPTEHRSSQTLAAKNASLFAFELLAQLKDVGPNSFTPPLETETLSLNVEPLSSDKKVGNVSVKTRFGQILDLVTQKVLERCEFDFRQDWQYEKDSTKLDFFFENIESSPVFMEATQTDRRDALRMKTLRYFNLVSQAKIRFGTDLVAVSLIYGNPSTRLSGSTVKSSLSFFDSSLIPQEDSFLDQEGKDSIRSLENKALELARDGFSRNKAIVNILENHLDAIDQLVKYFKKALPSVKTDNVLKQLWEQEIIRDSTSKTSTAIKPIETYYKAGVIKTLFLNEKEFNHLTNRLNYLGGYQEGLDLTDIGLESLLLEKLRGLKIAKKNSSVASNSELLLGKEISFVFQNSNALGLVSKARTVLSETEKAKWYFEDIYQNQRRTQMAKIFAEFSTQGEESFREAIFQNYKQETYAGIQHSRCWLLDFVSIELKKSQSELNNIIASYPDYTERIGAFQSIAIKLDFSDQRAKKLSYFIARAWQELGKTSGKIDELISLRRNDLTGNYDAMARKLLDFRLKSAVKLVNFDPLRNMLEMTLENEGWNIEEKRYSSILGDLLENSSKGKFKVFLARKNDISLIINVLQIIDAHKPQEWAARGRALRYRIQTNPNGEKQVVRQLEDAEFVFALDGKVTSKMRRQLERGGWRTCALDDLPEVLADIERKRS
ncbi:MAG: 5'-methylthioadenosine/S-adenosylhomocysteine nucleosidase [Cyanobacteria bacterium P01_B01_bin.77]